MKTLLIGLGTGRCGTTSLSKILSLQKDSNISHENNNLPALPWIVNTEKFDTIFNTIFTRNSTFIGDISFYWLPYVNKIITKVPNVKFIIIKRQKHKTIKSYEKWTTGRNHWNDHDGVKWKKNIWDDCYPKYNNGSKTKCLEMYYDEYYDTCKKIKSTNVYWIDTEDLNDENKVMKMLEFCGFENPTFKQIRENKGK